MPKDNDVDEKVVPVAWVSPTSLRTLDRDRQDSMWVMAERSEMDCCTEPLYSAATVAELRAEVERLRAALHIETHKVITCGVAASHPDASLSRRMEYAGKWDSPQAQDVRKLRDRADAAERRVGELEAAIHALQQAESEVRIHEAVNPRSRNYRLPVYVALRAARERMKSLTGADPT